MPADTDATDATDADAVSVQAVIEDIHTAADGDSEDVEAAHDAVIQVGRTGHIGCKK